MSTTLARTPLHDWHAKQGAKLVDFAGWSMPVYYESIVPEHQATRQCVGIFDISHMGRFCFVGPGAVPLLEGLLTRRVDNLGPGRVRYSLITNDTGGVLDDVLVSHLTTRDQSFYWLVALQNGTPAEVISHNSLISQERTWPKLEPEALHGIVGDIVRTIARHTEADPVTLVVHTISEFSAIIGRPAFTEIDGNQFRRLLSEYGGKSRMVGKTAFIVPTDLAFGLTRVLDTLVSLSGSEVEFRGFRDASSAYKWLGFDEIPIQARDCS